MQIPVVQVDLHNLNIACHAAIWVFGVLSYLNKNNVFRLTNGHLADDCICEKECVLVKRKVIWISCFWVSHLFFLLSFASGTAMAMTSPKYLQTNLRWSHQSGYKWKGEGRKGSSSLGSTMLIKVLFSFSFVMHCRWGYWSHSRPGSFGNICMWVFLALPHEILSSVPFLGEFSSEWTSFCPHLLP